MKERMLLRRTCSIYANDIHFATMIFPFVSKEISNNTTVRTILEKNEEKNIEKIIENIGLNSDIKEKIKKIDWNGCNINKIRDTFKILENDIKDKNNIDIIILGTNIFIQKVNKAIDLWINNNIEKLEENNIKLNIINCFSFEKNKQLNTILNSHEYILKTSGIEEILREDELLKAN